MLSNAYNLAKICFDTAENEPAKNLQNFRTYRPASGQKYRSVGLEQEGALVLLNDRPDARPRPAGRVERLELGEHAEHLGRAWVANKDFSELELRTSKFQV